MNTDPTSEQGQYRDHDLLIRIDEKVTLLTTRLDEKTGALNTIIGTKADLKDFLDHVIDSRQHRAVVDSRLSKVERLMYMAVGGMVIIQIAMQYVLPRLVFR